MNTKRNTILAYAYSFAAWFGITNLWVIYLGQQGLPLIQIGLCESIFHVASFCFEVPSGMLADRFSYKTVLYFSRIMAIISSLLMLIGHSFIWFAISFIVSAWSYNLQSGTLEALAYESLPQASRDARYAKVVSMISIVTEVGSTAGVIIAGALVHWHFEITYYISIVLGIVALGTIAFMQEPSVHGPREQRQTLAMIVRAAVHELRHQPVLRNLMLLDAVISTAGTAFYYYFQDVMTKADFAGWMISTLMLVSSLGSIAAMRALPWLQAKTSQLQLLLGITVAMTFALIVIAVPSMVAMIVMYLIIQAITAVMYPLFNAYYNELIPSKQRATLLSVASMLFSVVMIVLFPVCGWLVDRFSFNVTFGGFGLVLLLATIGWAVRQKRAA
ncbi:MFS transporter [Lacticaseibacillus sharpeae]|nr:MFS transporter [Lacticaseibacillus sharpeae]